MIHGETFATSSGSNYCPVATLNQRAVGSTPTRPTKFFNNLHHSSPVPALPVCVIGMEACGSAQHWGRAFEQLGPTVKLMHPKYVKPYVKTNKNDGRVAEAICEAVGRPTMRFVSIKTASKPTCRLCTARDCSS